MQFFSNPSGTDKGKNFIGQKSITTDGSGNVTFAFSTAQKVGLGRTIPATATSPGRKHLRVLGCEDGGLSLGNHPADGTS